ncbi:MAG: amino acid ABC transporter permease [Betaproteobacteria bacterium]
MAERTAPKKRDWSWRSQAVRGIIYQIIAVGLLGFAVWWLASNTLENMRVRGIQSGFGFLNQPAGFDIGESVIDFDSANPYWKAFLVGLSNTLRVAIIGIVLTTILGTLIGVGRLSKNFLLRGVCTVYVEVFRNIPVLIQLLMWYFILTTLLPPVVEAMHLGPGVYVSKSGMSFPIPVWGMGQALAALGMVFGLVVSWFYRRWAFARFERTGVPLATFWPSVAIVIGCGLLGWLAGGAPTALEFPEKTEMNVSGGGAVTPEFLAVVIGLTIYTAAFVAEIVRSGIQSVAWGQTEAASALGLARSQLLKLVLLPQAMRVIIPPMTNQYLNLTKNSSLAVAIGYPDLVSISNTTLNQTGRAVECIAIIMAVYLTLSLTTAALMNWYNSRAAIKER